MKLLSSSYYKESKSCIIYTNRRKETEYIYSYLHEQNYKVSISYSLYI